MPAVNELLLEHQPHQLLGRRGHIPEALTEGHHGEAVILQGLHHHAGVPAVIGNLTDVVVLIQLEDELLDPAIIDHIPLGGLDEALLLPHIVDHMVAPDAQVEGFSRYPEERQHDVRFILIGRREHQHKGCQVAGRGQVHACIAGTPLQQPRRNTPRAGIPLVHGHPADGLLDPLVETQLSEGVLFAGILPGTVTGTLHLGDVDGVPEGRVRLLPHLRVGPVLTDVRTENDRIEGRVVDCAVQHTQRLLM